MEESNLIPDDKNSIESTSDINKDTKKEENTKEFSEFIEIVKDREIEEERAISDLKNEKIETSDNSLFKKILNNGFDGITSNPNYKMLALLIILLINLSLFFVIGNIGKAFLRKTGIM